MIKFFEYQLDNISNPSIRAKEARLSYLLRLSADHPKRPVDWRWHLANLYLNGIIKRSTLDSISIDAYNFLKKLYELLEKDSVDICLAKLKKKYPDLMLAWSYGNDIDGNEINTNLQCYILSGVPRDVIISDFGLTPSAYSYYVSLFYDVIDRLDKPGYIIQYAVFRDEEKYNLRDKDNLDRLLAYMCGPEAVWARRRYGYLRSMKFDEHGLNEDSITIIKRSIKNNLLLRVWVDSEEALNSENAVVLNKLYDILQEESQIKSELQPVFTALKNVFDQNIIIRKMNQEEIDKIVAEQKQLSETVFNRKQE